MGGRVAWFRLMAICGLLAVQSSCKMRQPDSAVQRAESASAGIGTLQPYHMLGVRPDCTEAPLDYDTLANLMVGAKDQADFIERLPEGSLQTFTLVHSSDSAQSPGISPAYPGVIRMSANGKLIIRYTCDPDSPVYNTIEAIAFNDQHQAFEFHEFDYRAEKKKTFCGDCHTTSSSKPGEDMRPNWAMYDQWPGIFGSRDDHFPAASLDERNMFADFLAFRRSDPCYASLPWPKVTGKQVLPKAYANYPYGDTERNDNYALRPNLRFTEVLSHLLARRNFRRLATSPRYPYVKKLLAAEAAYCAFPAVRSRLEALLPAISYPQPHEINPPRFANDYAQTTQEPRHSDSRAVNLFTASLVMGFSPDDWTLNFNQPDVSAYATGISPGRNIDIKIDAVNVSDLPITALVQAQIVEDVTKSFESLRRHAKVFQTSRGESEAFGEQFACIDDLGGGLVFPDPEGHRQLCADLIGEIEQQLAGMYLGKNGKIVRVTAAKSNGRIVSLLAPGLDPSSNRFVCSETGRCFVPELHLKSWIQLRDEGSLIYKGSDSSPVLYEWIRP